MFKIILISIIKVYQRLISPLKPRCCRFYPSCSNYAVEALKKYNVFRGGVLIIKRIIRCHPYSPGGYDPLP